MTTNLTSYMRQIQGPLLQARLFWRVRLTLIVVICAAWASVMLFGLSRFFGDWGLLPALVALALSLMAGGIWYLLYEPKLIQLARRADVIFNLGERLSTALSVKPAAIGADHPLEQALLRDAAAHASRVDPLIIEPVLNRTLIALSVGLITSLLFINQLGLQSLHRDDQSAQTLLAPNLNADLRAQNLRSIAEALSADAEKKQNSYLSAIANAIQDLADQDDVKAHANRNSDLQELLEHARLAYGDAQPGWLRSPQALDVKADPNLTRLTQVMESLKPMPMQNGGGGEELVPELFSEHDAARQSAYTPMVVGEFRGTQEQSELKMSGQNVGPEGNEAQTTGQAKASASNSGTSMTLGDRGTREPITMDGAAAILAGGATQSSAGNSRLAGKGTQDLFDPNAKTQTSLEANDTMLLPMGTYQAGRRIRLQTLPATQSKDALTGGPMQNALNGKSQPNSKDDKTGMTRDRPSLQDEAMFSRAFKHSEGSLAP